MKKPSCTSFMNILNTIHEKGITTKAALMDNQDLWTSFWIATQDFVRFALRSKNGKTTIDGRKLDGNKNFLDTNESLGTATREDVMMDCVIRIVEYTDTMLKKPTVEYMKNYAFSIVNTQVYNIGRKLPPDGIETVSLNSTIKGTGVDADDAYTYEDIVADYKYAPDRVFSEKESIKELEKTLKAKQVREQAEKREIILHEVELLKHRPAEVMVRLGIVHNGMKPRELAARIIKDGVELVYAEIIHDVAKRNGIDLSEIRTNLAGHKLTSGAVKADTNSAAQVAGQISRLVYRADKRLCK